MTFLQLNVYYISMPTKSSLTLVGVEVSQFII